MVETQALSEAGLLDEQIDNHGLSPCSLERVQIDPKEWEDIEIDACFATRTIPMDRVDDIVFLATSSYLSRPVREYWEGKYGQTLVWYLAPFAQIEEWLLRFAEVLDAAKAEQEEA